MTNRGRKHRTEPWRELLIDELSDESDDDRRDFIDNASRDESEQKWVWTPRGSEHALPKSFVDGPEMLSDEDDRASYAQPKERIVYNGTTIKVQGKNGK